MNSMSTLPPKADIVHDGGNVRFVPKPGCSTTGVATADEIVAAEDFFAHERCNPSKGLKTYGFADQPSQLGLQKRLSQKGKAAPIRIAS
jgi:hypothetical protein